MTFSLFSTCGTEITFTPNADRVTLAIGDASMDYSADQARKIYRGFIQSGYTTEEPTCDPLPETEWDMSIDEADALTR